MKKKLENWGVTPPFSPYTAGGDVVKLMYLYQKLHKKTDFDTNQASARHSAARRAQCRPLESVGAVLLS